MCVCVCISSYERLTVAQQLIVLELLPTENLRQWAIGRDSSAAQHMVTARRSAAGTMTCIVRMSQRERQQSA